MLLSILHRLQIDFDTFGGVPLPSLRESLSMRQNCFIELYFILVLMACPIWARIHLCRITASTRCHQLRSSIIFTPSGSVLNFLIYFFYCLGSTLDHFGQSDRLSANRSFSPDACKLLVTLILTRQLIVEKFQFLYFGRQQLVLKYLVFEFFLLLLEVFVLYLEEFAFLLILLYLFELYTVLLVLVEVSVI